MRKGLSKKKYLLSILIILSIGIPSYFIFKKIAIKEQIANLEYILRNSPEKVEERHRLGLLYMYKGELEKAEKEFLAILKVAPYDTKALSSIGMVYYRKGESYRALTYWRSLLEIEPGNQFIWNLVNKISKGKTISHEGTQSVNPDWEYHYQMGQQSYQGKDYANAVEHFNKAMELNPEDFRTYFNIGASYYEMKELEKAKQSWEKALKYKKDDLLTMRLISLAQEGIYRRKEIGELQKLLKKEPSNLELHRKLGDAYLKDKSTVREAEREYLEVLRLNPSHTPTYERLIELNVALDDYDKAIHYARQSLKTAPRDISGKKRLDALLAYKKFREKGIENWRKNGMANYSEMVQIPGNNAVFYIDKYEVINAQYQAFLKATSHLPPPRWDDAAVKGKENYPVTNVSWYDAVIYCKWAGKRLPTEEEWIRAAWGGNDARYPWGSNFDVNMANTAESGFKKPTPVGSYSSRYGLYDMVGNVMEWTSSEKPQPSAGEAYRIKKGGSALSAMSGPPPYGRWAEVQWSASPSQQDNTTGFRCVK